MIAPRGSNPQPDLPHVLDDAAPGEDEVAVPAMAAVVRGLVRRNEVGGAAQLGEIEQAHARAGALVGFLQGDDVSVDLADHAGDARRIEASVAADAFVDIVGSDGGGGAFAGEVDGTRRFLAQGGGKRGGKRLRVSGHAAGGLCPDGD